MKRLNKPPELQKVVHYGPAGGFNHDYSFAFSEELPYKKRKNMSRYMKAYNKKKKEDN